MEVVIEKIVSDGKSLAHIDGKAVFIHGGLPGEKVEIEIYKRRKDYDEARLIEVLKPSNDRQKPMEDHYLICSPWQVLDYDKQIEYKRTLLAEAYKDFADTKVNNLQFYGSNEKFGYRTKLEFSFTTGRDGKIVLAFHKRGVNNEYEITPDGCKLGSEKMNAAALKITEILNKISGVEAKGLKSLTIRQSKTNGQIIAILLHKFREYEITISLSELEGLVDGIIIGYSTIKSPISVITEIRYQEGKEYLEEEIAGLQIRYPYDGFFQNNLPMFEKTLAEMGKWATKVDRIVELYSGTGSIGLYLSKFAKQVSGVEIIESAVKYADINKELNGINNYSAICLPDHKISADLLENTNILVLDPPRCGLHQKTTKLILDSLPDQIIYLSCNPVTQARDLGLLKEKYEIRSLSGFDFYPNTFHMESLLILEIRKA